MDTQNLLTCLIELAESFGIEIRRAPLGGDGGGLCLLKGKNILFLDTNAALPDKLSRTAAALAQLDLEETYIVPQVRELLDQYRKV